MGPETTTEPATQEPGGQQPQPEEQPATADTPEPEPTPTTAEPSADEPVTTDNPADDEDIAAWAERKGIDLSTPEGQAKALKSMRESEKKMHETARSASELKKQIQASPAQTEDERFQRLETMMSVNQWKDDNKITPEQDAKMGEYLSSDPMKIRMVTAGLLSLDDVFQLSGAARIDPAAIKKQGGQEALEQLAIKQRATAPKGSATTHDTPKDDPIAAALAD